MPSPNSRFFLRDLLPGLAFLALGTLFFRLGDADIAWCNPWREGSDWPHGEDFPWSLLYHLGTYPALLLVLAALGVLLAGCRSARWARYRKQAVYLVAVLAIGPGIIANALLKDHWGRPRPRDVEALGGPQAFEPILTMDPASPGKSFPCGHATMGFFFFTGYFLLRRSHPRLAAAVLAVALVFGFLIGWARVVQGGHFPSDVLWAGGVVWLVAATMARWMNVEEPVFVNPGFKPMSWPALAAVFLLVPASLFLVLLATPVDHKESFAAQGGGPGPLDLRLRVPLGETTVSAGAGLAIQAESLGFGFPGGGIKSVWKEVPGENGAIGYDLKQRVSGLQTELNQSLHVAVPPDRLRHLNLTQQKGTVRIRLPATRSARGPRRWTINLAEGNVIIEASSLPVAVRVGETPTADPPDPADDVRLLLGPGASLRLPHEPRHLPGSPAP